MIARATSVPWMKWTDPLAARASLLGAIRENQLAGSRSPPLISISNVAETLEFHQTHPETTQVQHVGILAKREQLILGDRSRVVDVVLRVPISPFERGLLLL